MREIIRNFEEFKAKADLTKPLHHSGLIMALNNFMHRLVFRVYALDKSGSHVIVYEFQKASPLADVERLQNEYYRLVEKFAKPLGSTEGAWVP
jgi:hypothetical protein